MSAHVANRIRNRYAEATERLAEVAGEGFEVGVLREQFAAVVQDLMRFEDENWVKLFGNLQNSEKGFALQDLKELVPYLEKQTKILQDLLGRGLRLKNNHVFGRGYVFDRESGESIPPRFQRIIDDPDNQELVFSPTALKQLNRIIFTSGNLLVMYNKKTKKFTRLAVDINVENYISRDDDPTRMKYILRKWESRDDITTGESSEKMEWVPTSSYDASIDRPTTYPKTIKYGNKNIPVNRDAVVIVKTFNKDNGETWGVPDAFGAAAPAHIYASYTRDQAMLTHALAAISFVVKAKTQAAAKSAGAKLQNGRVGQAAITGPETEVQSMPRAGSVNMYEGRPLAARVASALDVSVTGITSDTGTGGSYASENALSAPEQMSALSRQEDFINFFAEVFRVMGSDVRINFARLDTDPIHRQFQSLGLARTLGGINQQEYRNRSLELLDIEPTTTELPEPDEFTGSKYATLAGQIEAGLMDDPDPDNSGSAIASQGNSGDVGSLDDDNSARDSDQDAGTA